MENNYRFIVATPKNEQDFSETPTAVSLKKLNLTSQTHVVYNNSIGLTKVYNSFIKDEKNKNNFLVFLHDDILLEDVFILEKLSAGFELFDIIGLAGTKKCDLSRSSCAWHLLSEPKEFVGEVSHSKDKMFWTNSYGPTPSRALLIDGLFMAVNVPKLLETSTFFDEDFDFHHYDISFCLNANKNKLKIGVFPIKLVHYGLGDSMLTDDWKKSNEKFKVKNNI
jgi:predicted RNA-binding protein